jgi:hypothetical protein
VFDGIDRRDWGGNGYFIQMTHTPRDVVVDHNTIVSGDSSGIAQIEEYVKGFVFTNNLTAVGEYGIIASGKGIGNDAIRASLPGALVTANVLAGAAANTYPPGNFFPRVQDFHAQFMDFNGHDFRLKPTSPWAHAGTDGKGLGAHGPGSAPLPVLTPSRR